MHPRLVTRDVQNKSEAVQELIRLRHNVEGFSARTRLELTADNVDIKLIGQIRYDDQSGWNIELFGPLGIKVAQIEADEKNYYLHSPISGMTLEGSIDEEIEIPNLDLTLRSLNILTTFLFPLVDIKDEDKWQLTGKPESTDDVLILKRDDASTDSLVLHVDYSPLKVLKEERWKGGEHLITRSFTFDKNSSMFPNVLVIDINEMRLKVLFRSLNTTLKSDFL